MKSNLMRLTHHRQKKIIFSKTKLKSISVNSVLILQFYGKYIL